MKRIPHAREVRRALRELRASIKVAWKDVNSAAAKAITRGDYGAGEKLAALGRKVQEFLGSIEALSREWRMLTRDQNDGADDAPSTRLAQWEYYQPVLQALVEVGGEARKADLEPIVERLLRARFQASDHEGMSSGRERCTARAKRFDPSRAQPCRSRHVP